MPPITSDGSVTDVPEKVTVNPLFATKSKRKTMVSPRPRKERKQAKAEVPKVDAVKDVVGPTMVVPNSCTTPEPEIVAPLKTNEFVMNTVPEVLIDALEPIDDVKLAVPVLCTATVLLDIAPAITSEPPVTIVAPDMGELIRPNPLDTVTDAEHVPVVVILMLPPLAVKEAPDGTTAVPPTEIEPTAVHTALAPTAAPEPSDKLPPASTLRTPPTVAELELAEMLSGPSTLPLSASVVTADDVVHVPRSVLPAAVETVPPILTPLNVGEPLIVTTPSDSAPAPLALICNQSVSYSSAADSTMHSSKLKASDCVPLHSTYRHGKE